MLYAVSHRRHTVFDVACIISALVTKTSSKLCRFSENAMTEITIKLEGPDLASRRTAAIERHKLLGHTAAGNKVAVDLSNVVSLSYSYADELIGVLAAIKGWEWLIKNVQLKGANEHVLRVVAEAINRRLKETGQPVKRSA